MIYYRLIALWVLCETMLGSVIHGVKLPGTGLILGSCAVLCISLIAYYFPSKGSILKATVIVAIFKMMLSPHSSPMAYIAVFFQGMMGEVLFWNRKMFSVSCLLLGVLVLVESGLQRIIVLTIIYGKDLWEAVNTFLNSITGKTTYTDYSFLLMMGYILLHVLVGAVVGLWAGKLPRKIQLWITQHQEYFLKEELDPNDRSEIHIEKSRKKKFKTGVIIIWAALLVLYIQSTFHIGPEIIASNVALRIFTRSLLMIMVFYFVIGPLLAGVLHRWLQKRKVNEANTIQQILQFLPDTKQLVLNSWQLTAKIPGKNRILQCSKIVLLNLLYFAHEDKTQ